jgi:hypothetical protein
MNRKQLLAAETFHYSYAHYADRLGGNIRFDKWMPDDVDTLERAEQEGWDDSRLAQALKSRKIASSSGESPTGGPKRSWTPPPLPSLFGVASATRSRTPSKRG